MFQIPAEENTDAENDLKYLIIITISNSSRRIYLFQKLVYVAGCGLKVLFLESLKLNYHISHQNIFIIFRFHVELQTESSEKF